MHTETSRRRRAVGTTGALPISDFVQEDLKTLFRLRLLPVAMHAWPAARTALPLGWWKSSGSVGPESGDASTNAGNTAREDTRLEVRTQKQRGDKPWENDRRGCIGRFTEYLETFVGFRRLCGTAPRVATQQSRAVARLAVTERQLRGVRRENQKRKYCEKRTTVPRCRLRKNQQQALGTTGGLVA